MVAGASTARACRWTSPPTACGSSPCASSTSERRAPRNRGSARACRWIEDVSAGSSRQRRARPRPDRDGRVATRWRPSTAAAPRVEGSSPATVAPSASARSRQTDPLGNPKLTFDQFVIGDCNRLAHAAALTVAEMPAQAYNPLFICGPPGVGKTHLLSAIANLLATHNPDADGPLYDRARPSRTSSWVRSVHGSTERFKRRFSDVDVLLVDDVQFLERKAKTEEEFFHTFNALHDGGPPDRPHLRSPAARPAGARGSPARALPGRPRRRHLPA